MQSLSIHENPVFHDSNPYAEPLFVAPTGRVLRFALRPGQTVREHTAPSSPVYLVSSRAPGSSPARMGRNSDLDLARC